MSGRTSTPKSIAAIARFARVFWPFVRQQWRLAAIGISALVATTLVRVLEPWPLKFVIDRISGLPSGRARVSVDAINDVDTTTLLALSAIALTLIATLRAALSYASTIGFALAGNRALTAVRQTLFDHLQNLSLRYHAKARGGDTVVRMIGDVGMVQEVAVTAVLPLLGNILTLMTMLAVMFWLDTQLALVATATLPLMAVLTLRRGKRIRHAARRTRGQEGALAATAAESLSAIKTVQSMSLGDRFMGAFSTQNNASMSEGVKVKRLSAGLERGVDVLIAIATATVLWLGATRVVAGQLSPGELLVFLFYLKSAFRPLRDSAKYGARLAKASAAGERIIELFEQQSEIVDRADAVPVSDVKGHIAFEGVRFAYDENKIVLDDISFVMHPGEHVALVGHSGSGKSTIASLLLRLHDPTRGTVSVDGVDLRDVQKDSWRQHIGTVLQDTVLFSGSIRDNISFGLSDVSTEAIVAAAKLANIHDFIVSLQDGYDAQVGERGVNLSNGQRQRIAIARAAIRNTPVLILDEPTTGLDQENESLVLQALARLSRNRTTLHITHRQAGAQHADRIIFLHDGRIVESGSHTELIHLGGHYADLFTQPANRNAVHATRR